MTDRIFRINRARAISIFLCFAVCLIALAPSLAGALPEVVARPTRPGPDKDAAKFPDAPETGPMDVFAAIEGAWNNRSVDGILAHFGDAKVTLSIEGAGPKGGSFSRSQSYYLLKDLFKYTITRKFEFVQYRKPNKASRLGRNRTSFAVAERYYQRTDDGRLLKDKVFVSLHYQEGPKGGRWVVDEIKSIR